MKNDFLLGVLTALLFSISTQTQFLKENRNRSFDLGVPLCASSDRGEALTYVPADDSLWVANDSTGTLCGIDRFTAEELQLVKRTDVFQPFQNDDGGLRSDELELIASDGGNTLYMINNVNISSECNPKTDIAVIYKLTRPAPFGEFSIAESHDLNPGAHECDLAEPVFHYKAMVVIDGSIYIADDATGEIHLYDYYQQEMTTFPDSPLLTITGNPKIVDLAYDGNFLWVLRSQSASNSRLDKYDWKTLQLLTHYDLSNLISVFARWGGIAVAGREIYLVTNDSNVDNKIHVFTEQQITE